MMEFLLENRGLFVFSDPGAAKAVLALVRQLKGKGMPVYKVISDRNHAFYSQFGIEVEVISSNKPDHLIESFSPDYIFTGTSYTSVLEVNCLSFAKRNKIPSYSFIDHWTSLKNRFRLKDEYVFPENVLVVDEKAYNLAKLEGIPAGLLKIFPNPYYNQLQNWKPAVSKEIFLKRNGLDDFQGKIISYLPEPLSNVGGISQYGLDEYYCLEFLYQTTLSLKDKKFILLVKPHPNQDKEKINEKVLFLARNGKVWLKTIEEDINTLIYYSDLVVGIFSNALVEASFFHKPIFRILKGLTIADPLASMSVGKSVYSEEELANELKKHL